MIAIVIRSSISVKMVRLVRFCCEILLIPPSPLSGVARRFFHTAAVCSSDTTKQISAPSPAKGGASPEHPGRRRTSFRSTPSSAAPDIPSPESPESPRASQCTPAPPPDGRRAIRSCRADGW